MCESGLDAKRREPIRPNNPGQQAGARNGCRLGTFPWRKRKQMTNTKKAHAGNCSVRSVETTTELTTTTPGLEVTDPPTDGGDVSPTGQHEHARQAELSLGEIGGRRPCGKRHGLLSRRRDERNTCETVPEVQLELGLVYKETEVVP